MATAELRTDGQEWVRSRDGSNSLTYIVFFDPATEDEIDIENAVYAVAPLVYRGKIRNSVSFRFHSYQSQQAVVRYTSKAEPDTSGGAEPEFSFEITTQQVKVLAALSVISGGNASGETRPNNGVLIGVQNDGTIEGVDVPQMAYSFSEVHYFNAAAITTAYKVTCATLCGTVNFGAGFKGFAAGEVMSTGISGSRRGEDLWQLRYSFAVLPNVSGLTVGPISGINKAGWDYLEWYTKEKENLTTKKLERKLIGYDVKRVLRQGNFASFGIGTT